MKIPFFDAERQLKKTGSRILPAVKKTILSGRYILGEQVENFENKFASYIGAKYCVGVNSGTDAIKIALKACGIGALDTVITVSNTAVPTVSAIREIGAIPYFADIDDYFCIDLETVPKDVLKKAKAVVAVHLYGQACDMTKISYFCEKYHLTLIEDCAQATGAEWQGKKVGSFGKAACFSFYPTKNLSTCGDGGAIVTSDGDLAKRSKMLRKYGMDKEYYANFEGYNSRLDEIHAGILLSKLPALNNLNDKRIALADTYRKTITNPLIELPKTRPGGKHVFHLFVIRTKERKRFLEYLSKKGIGYGIHYPYPIHLQPAYEFLGIGMGRLPNTERAAEEIVSLPIFPELKKTELAYIAESINAFK